MMPGCRARRKQEPVGLAEFPRNCVGVTERSGIATANVWTHPIRSDTMPATVRWIDSAERSGMETTLHRQLKALYSTCEESQEVAVDGYRIDAVTAGTLVEIQYGSLGAIRDKIRTLLTRHQVLVVKPLAARKYLITRKGKGKARGKTSSRYSPSKAGFHHLFDDLVHFTNVFPHPNLTLEVVLTEQEEHRIPIVKRRMRSKGYRVEDRLLRHVQGRLQLRTHADLVALVPEGLPLEFSTTELAVAADIPRWLAQKMAYCLRTTGTAEVVGKKGNSLLYRICKRAA